MLHKYWLEQVAGSGSQVPWAPGALDPPLPDYVVKYQQRCLAASADAAPEPEETSGVGASQVAASNNDTVSFQRKILPNAAEIHPEADECAPPTQHQVIL